LKQSRSYKYGLWLLTRREYGAEALKEKMLSKEASLTEVEQAILLLQSQGYQSDERYTQSFIRSRLQKGQGLRRIKRDLLTIKIDKELIDRIFFEFDIDWNAQALLTQRKKYKNLPLTIKEIQQQTRFLLYRGFEFSAIQHALQQELITELMD